MVEVNGAAAQRMQAHVRLVPRTLARVRVKGAAGEGDLARAFGVLPAFAVTQRLPGASRH